jgi:hypothetical protein
VGSVGAVPRRTRKRDRVEQAQPFDKIKAHLGPEGPAKPAHEFLKAVLIRRDFGDAWPRLDDTLRLCIVQSWLWANRKSRHPLMQEAMRDRDAAAAALADENPRDTELWQAFAKTQQERIVDTLVSTTRDPTKLSVASRPRPIGAGLELVLFVDSHGGEHMIFRPTVVPVVYRIVMRRTDKGWRVAGIMADKPPKPGWPPEFPPAAPVPPPPPDD